MTIEVTAKKVDDAISQGLKQLGASLDEVNVEVVDAGGLFRKAKVRLTLERESAATAPAKSEQKPPEAVKPITAEKTEKTDKAEKPQSGAKPAEHKAEKAKPAEKAQQSAGNSKNAQAPSATEKQSDQDEQTKNVVNQDGAKSDRKAQDRDQKPHHRNADQKAKQGDAKQGKQQAASQDADASSEAQQGGDQSANRVEHAKPRKLTAEDKAAAVHALEFVKTVAEKMGFTELTVEADETGEFIEITAPAGDDSLLIGRHGETLSAVSYLAETCARAEKCHINITVDCNGYRERRAASLSAMAKPG